jgi:hypothetical protein
MDEAVDSIQALLNVLRLTPAKDESLADALARTLRIDSEELWPPVAGHSSGPLRMLIRPSKH